MTTKDEEYMDDDQTWLRKVERDFVEAAEFEFESVHSLIGGDAGEQRKSSLLLKLEADPEQDFSVTNYSTYKENRWVLEKVANSTAADILFNSDLSGGNDLKKVLTYHLIPQFHPFGRLRSFNSTRTYAWAYGLLEEYLFKPNGLNATSESISVISERLINDALDQAKIQGTPRNYFLLYFIVTFWQSLSAQALIPATHRLDVPLQKIDTKDRQQDIQNEIASEHKGWQPFTEEELSLLIEHAIFWTEKAIPALLRICRFLKQNGITDQNHLYVIRRDPWKELESILGQEVDGKTVCGYNQVIDTQKVTSTSGRILEYPQHKYWFQKQLRSAIDKVRDGLLILVALITGMRNREIAALTFGDVIQLKNGEWVINVTRFKTSDDPNYFGTSEEIPLPSFIGRHVRAYEKLRSFDDYMRSGMLFEQIGNPRKATKLNRAIYRAMSNLSEDVGVVGIHPHRFRKTIAEILINRSERNVDLIRMLFGHKSYKMTLRYIARNPYLVSSVAEILEAHFTEDFLEIVAGLREGAFSGVAAERIAKTTAKRPELFKGRLLRMTIFNYISYLLEAGEPVFIKRTGIGTYCVSSERYTEHYLPPCLAKAIAVDGDIKPDPSNCQLDCKHAVVLEKAKGTLQKNIVFYTNLLEQSSGKLSKNVHKELAAKISANEKHLAALSGKSNDSISKESALGA